MAVTIRTGANGSYKSSYVAYFVILPALKAGRIVVTNIEGMQPLHKLQERLGIEFPTTARLIRITSRDTNGLKLWQHFFCWCPLGALIVIDECQDIYSKKIGFKLEKIAYQPLDHFLPLLPPNFESLFNSRYTPADLSNLDESETDDRGQREYDDDGKIIYPFNFNEGFMRHRKYNWDIELLSPDWAQIDSGIKACAEQCFFHKGRDQYFWAKRNPFIYKHSKAATTPTIPKGKDPNLSNKKIPLDAFLLYKSTATGKAQGSGALNLLFSNYKFYCVLLIIIFGIGYLVYGISNLVFGSSSTVENAKTQTNDVTQSPETNSKAPAENVPDVSSGSNSDSSSHSLLVPFVPVRSILYFEGLETAYISGVHKRNYVVEVSGEQFDAYELDLVINVEAKQGRFSIDKFYLEAVGVEFKLINDCLLELSNGRKKALITCEPNQQAGDSFDDREVSREVANGLKDNSYFM